VKRVGKWLLVWMAASVVFAALWSLLLSMSKELETTDRHPGTGYLRSGGGW
jgi:hypothetical protein